MEKNLSKRSVTRKRRSQRVRNALQGRYRLYVHKTNRHLAAQLIDDEAGKTLVSVSTLSKEFKKDEKCKSKDTAVKLGSIIAKLAKEKQVENVVFDRGRFKYHGLIALLAESARKAGLKF